jgi:hypothetical protein
MTPLKTELDALEAVLTTPLGDFLTDKDQGDRDKLTATAQKRMFTKAIQAVDEARGGRNMWMVVLRHGHESRTFYTGFGPYGTKAQAEKAAQGDLMGLEPTAYAIVATRNKEGLAQLMDMVDELPAPVKVSKDQERINLKRMGQLASNHSDITHMRGAKVKNIGSLRGVRAREGL